MEDGEAAPSEIDLARLELNCAKASLRLKDATAASDHARKALQRHAAASNNSVYANAAAVLGEEQRGMPGVAIASTSSESEPKGRYSPSPSFASESCSSRQMAM